MKQLAFIFPGQGAQYIGMGKEFYAEFAEAKELFEQADDLLQTNLSHLIFSGEEKELTQTKNSQLAIFVTSLAMLKVLQHRFSLEPTACAGLSLGEYSALVASGHMPFADALLLVQKRALFMHEACEAQKGTMAVVLGMADDAVEEIVYNLRMPESIWAANFNCPGQVVISGTEKGIEAASKALSEKGAKRILPLQVHGAFHSGLMKPAQERLTPYIMQTECHNTKCLIAMNAIGTFCSDGAAIKENLIKQVTSPVLWHKCVSAIMNKNVDLFIEIGPGKTLSGMNKRIGISAPTLSLEKPEDLSNIEQTLS